MDEQPAETGDLLALTQRLVSEVVDGCGWCHLTRDDGGRCKEPDVAVRWEDGFMDVVCERHAERARERGALVVYPPGKEGP